MTYRNTSGRRRAAARTTPCRPGRAPATHACTNPVRPKIAPPPPSRTFQPPGPDPSIRGRKVLPGKLAASAIPDLPCPSLPPLAADGVIALSRRYFHDREGFLVCTPRLNSLRDHEVPGPGATSGCHTRLRRTIVPAFWPPFRAGHVIVDGCPLFPAGCGPPLWSAAAGSVASGNAGARALSDVPRREIARRKWLTRRIRVTMAARFLRVSRILRVNLPVRPAGGAAGADVTALARTAGARRGSEPDRRLNSQTARPARVFAFGVHPFSAGFCPR